MKLAIMQPYIFPYLGYFQLISAVDKFVFLDNVNFIKKGWINRNNILLGGQSHLITIPCKSISQNRLISETEVIFNEAEKKRFLNHVAHSYKQAPYFEYFYPHLDNFIRSTDHQYISELAISSIKFIWKHLGKNSLFDTSSHSHQFSESLVKQNKIIAIAKYEEASTYVNPIGGKHLYKESEFRNSNMELQFLTAQLDPYTQFDHSFVSALSILDVLMFNSSSSINSSLNRYKIE